MRNVLVAVDLQKDFVDGALGSAGAQAIIPAAAARIAAHQGEIYVTFDTHHDDYMETREGQYLPVPHCIKGTDGWELNDAVRQALSGKCCRTVEKNTFGSVDLPEIIRRVSDDTDLNIELIGLCTDICVVSNALLLKAHFPQARISVNAACCAGVTPEKHLAALETMRSCQIDVI